MTYKSFSSEEFDMLLECFGMYWIGGKGYVCDIFGDIVGTSEPRGNFSKDGRSTEYIREAYKIERDCDNGRVLVNVIRNPGLLKKIERLVSEKADETEAGDVVESGDIVDDIAEEMARDQNLEDCFFKSLI